MWNLEFIYSQILPLVGITTCKPMSTVEITKFLDIEAKVNDEGGDESFESEGDYGAFFDLTSDWPSHFFVDHNEDYPKFSIKLTDHISS
jgi:hypothetical protein